MARTKATHRRSQAHQRHREARCAALIGIPSAAAAEEPDKQVVNDHSTQGHSLHAGDPQADCTKAALSTQQRYTQVPISTKSAPDSENTISVPTPSAAGQAKALNAANQSSK